MRIVRYSFVGGAAAIIDLTIFFIFAKQLNYNYLVIGVIGFIIATLVNYFLSIKYVFNSGSRFNKKHQEISLIYLVSFVGLIAQLAILYVLIDIFLFEKMLSKFAATGLVFLWNYFARHYIIFRGT